MSRHVLVLNTDSLRDKAVSYVRLAQNGVRVEFKGPRRSNDQNAKMWACLSDIARQLKWHGVQLSADDWKLVFLDALKREVRMVPNIDGNGFVNLGQSSSDLSKEEMADMITLILQFGDAHGVEFSEPREKEFRDLESPQL